MNLIGGKVIHKKFGEGIIVEVKDRYVSVDFNGVIKFFLIETIETFFSFEDENLLFCNYFSSFISIFSLNKIYTPEL